MKLFIFAVLITTSAFAQYDAKKDDKKKEKMDYGDKQLLNRDSCRKPIEALETKYPQYTREQLEKMKAKCDY